MKYEEFNRYDEKNYRRPINNFKGPYIKSIPDIKIFDIIENDEYIVLATDGLWDYLSSKDVGEIIKLRSKENPTDIAKNLFFGMLAKVSKEYRMTVPQILNMPAGDLKRRIHDDVSIIVFDLKH